MLVDGYFFNLFTINRALLLPYSTENDCVFLAQLLTRSSAVEEKRRDAAYNLEISLRIKSHKKLPFCHFTKI